MSINATLKLTEIGTVSILVTGSVFELVLELPGPFATLADFRQAIADEADSGFGGDLLGRFDGRDSTWTEEHRAAWSAALDGIGEDELARVNAAATGLGPTDRTLYAFFHVGFTQPKPMRLAISIFEIDEFGVRVHEDDEHRIESFAPEDLLHIADCLSVGNDDPPEDVSDTAQNAADAFEVELRIAGNAAIERRDTASES